MIDLTSDKIRSDVVKRKFYDEDDSFFEELNITREDYLDINKYLIELSDGYYYAKRVTEFQLCNEIVGRYLGNKLGLDTTSLEILFDKGKVKIVTPNFKKKNVVYKVPIDDIKLMTSHEYNVDNLKLLPREYQEEQLKLIAVDLMMEQTDRYARNMEVYSDINGNKHLSPIIDFAFAFENINNYSYFNPYIAIEKMPRVLSLFYNKYPEGFPYFKKIFSSCSEELFAYIEDNYPVKVNLEVKDNIRKTIDKNQKILKLMNRG